MPRKRTVISASDPERQERARFLGNFLKAEIPPDRPDFQQLQAEIRAILRVTLQLRPPDWADRRPLEGLERNLGYPGARRAAGHEIDRRIRAGRALNRLEELLAEVGVGLGFARVAPIPELRQRTIPVVPLRPVFRLGPRDPSLRTGTAELIFAVYEAVLGYGQVFLARCGHLVTREAKRGRRPVTCGAEDCLKAARQEPVATTTARAETRRRMLRARGRRARAGKK